MNPRIENYISATERHSDVVLAEMEDLARRTGFPIIGPQVGHLIQVMVASLQPRRVLEMGAGYGYSALWAASVMPADSRVVCIDLDPENRDLGLKFISRADLAPTITYEIGNALEVAQRYEQEDVEPFDFIFNDVDKEDYGAAFDVALGLLRPGGVLMTDNTLWFGYVAEPARTDAATAGVRSYNTKAANHPELVTSIVPIRDGVTVSTRTGKKPDPSAS
ncbi:MAG: methyltransferase domain-containing protein [Spirochaetes bacterium]|nr:methyltransferase domain-containing protein [Spirochaetota bacterium]